MRPQYRRFGFVDFDAMGVLASSDDADEFVCRRANGDNVLVTRADIIAGAGVVPDPLLLGDGAVGAPTYSFLSDPLSGAFLAAAGEYALAANGIEAARIRETAGAAQFLVPVGTEAFPSMAFVNDSDTGFFNQVGVLSVVTNGTTRASFSSAGITAGLVGSFAIRNEAPTATNPVLTPAGTDADTGIGWFGPNELSFIAGGISVARLPNVLGTVQFIVPQQDNSGNPSIGFGDGDSGFFEAADEDLQVTLDAVARWRWFGNAFEGIVSGSAALRNEASSNTNPTLIPDNTDVASGVGGITGQIALIAGGLKCMSVSESGGARQIGFYDGSPIPLQTGVAVTTAAVHAALVSLRLITA